MGKESQRAGSAASVAQPELRPLERCPRYWVLYKRLSQARSGSEDANELLETMRYHIRECEDCQAWWQSTKDEGYVMPHKDGY